MASRAVVIPEVFTGEGSQTWSDWQDHLDSVAEVAGTLRTRSGSGRD